MRLLGKVGEVQRHAVVILLVTATAYCVVEAVEAVEAVGLWRERRWAEYLTALTTAGFLPFEVHELLVRVTVFRMIGALAVNVAILVWLLWRKRLFGLNGGRVWRPNASRWTRRSTSRHPARRKALGWT